MATPIHARAGIRRGTTVSRSADATSAAEARFLAALGKRVRNLREQRDWTRKILAREANVSERYLGQLESGDGNVSVILLRRIALALNVSLSGLFLPDPEGVTQEQLLRRILRQLPAHHVEQVLFRILREVSHDDPSRQGRIALIGLRGAGKTALGTRLAREWRRPFIELDHEIEQETGLPLSEIFTLYGPSGYRRLERRCLVRVVTEHDHAVIAVGGGVVAEEDTFNLLRAQCYTVWLKAQPEEHMARVLAQGDLRPMAGRVEAMEELKRILAEREPLYQQADACLDTSGQTVEQSFQALRHLLQSYAPTQEETHGTDSESVTGGTT